MLTDKSFANRNVIAAQFPNAVHHLCIFHVGQIFCHEITTTKREITAEQRKTCLNILTKMIYANSEEHYNDLYTELENTGCQSNMQMNTDTFFKLNLLIIFCLRCRCH